MKRTLDSIKNEILHSYGAPDVIAQIEEMPSEIKVAIKYNELGDEYIYIKTKEDECYIYGYFTNLIYRPDKYLRDTVSHIADENNAYGIAGKIADEYGYLDADEYMWAIINGEEVDIKTLDIKERIDEEYNTTYVLLVDEL